MSRGFNGTTSNVKASAGTFPGWGITDSYTIAAIVKAAGAGESNQGFIFQASTGVGTVSALRIEDASLHIGLLENTATTDGAAISTETLSTGVWYVIIGTFRQSDVTPRLYFCQVGGIPVEVTYGTQTTAGTRTGSVDELTIGNEIGSSRTWNGDIAVVAACKHEWSESERNMFAMGWIPLQDAAGTDYVVIQDYRCPGTAAPPDLAARTTYTGTSLSNTEDPPLPQGLPGGPVAISVTAAAGGTVTGDAAWTEDADTVAAAGTFGPTGTAAWTEAADTVAASGSVGVSGTSAWTEANDTAAAAGWVLVTGTAAWTEAADTCVGAGTFSSGGPVTFTTTPPLRSRAVLDGRRYSVAVLNGKRTSRAILDGRRFTTEV